MSSSLEQYTTDLHQFLDVLPAELRRRRVDELRTKAKRLLDEMPQSSGDEQLGGLWKRLEVRLKELHAALSVHSQASHAAVLAKYEELSRSYEQWRIEVAARTTAEAKVSDKVALKPLIRARTAFHVGMGVVATVCYQFLLTRTGACVVLFTLLAVFSSLEISRRFSPRFNHFLVTTVFKTIARPDEYFRINSSTYYLIALCMVTPFFTRPAVLVGILILAFADPAAAWIGKRWGKRKLYGRKSVIGSSAFMATGFVVSLAFLSAFYSDFSLLQIAAIAAGASLAGTLAELFSIRVDDNLTVPLASVLGASAMMIL